MSQIMIRSARLSFGKLFTPEAFKNPDGTSGKAKFSGHFIIPANSPQVADIKAAFLSAANEKWKGKAPAILEAMDAKNKSLRNGASMLDKAGDPYAQYVDQVFVNASNATRPTLLNRNKAMLAESDGVLYDGCYVDALVEFYGYEKPGHAKGVYCNLLGVRFVRDGDAFGAAKVANVDAFDDLDEDESGDAVDPLA